MIITVNYGIDNNILASLSFDTLDAVTVSNELMFFYLVQDYYRLLTMTINCPTSLSFAKLLLVGKVLPFCFTSLAKLKSEKTLPKQHLYIL